MSCPISHILSVSRLHCTMDKNQIMHSVTEETGELATEVSIEAGYKNRMPGRDGIVGEAIDVIVSAVDMIYAANPHITMQEIQGMVEAKCQKWANNATKVKANG